VPVLPSQPSPALPQKVSLWVIKSSEDSQRHIRCC
jgi:hypothetical protein